MDVNRGPLCKTASSAWQDIQAISLVVTFREGSMSRRCTKEALRLSAACSCSPLRVNGWHGGDISHMSARKLSSAPAVMPSRFICSTTATHLQGSGM